MSLKLISWNTAHRTRALHEQVEALLERTPDIVALQGVTVSTRDHLAHRLADGSGWLLPAMGGYHRGHTYGVGFYGLTKEWATIKGGITTLAQFKDLNGARQAPTSGYIRFVAWQ